ncbi:MND1 [Candida jiufengensis]|uniref:MND1 n=1 Tax=Candida jiufengensis TaxID=497108 RepID=UPI0022253EE4|nr:MND1 [Candida jiufengensis]KAI5954416.1 MND1 [Candida jiufengensis]
MPPKAKKGKSLEEKQKDLLEWFQSNHDFYPLKEIEQKASKNCKISSIQIKELVNNLVNEGFIEVEKCGTTNLYWSFKYNQIKLKEDKLTRLSEEIKENKDTSKELEQKLQVSEEERSTDKMPDRDEKVLELDTLSKEIADLNSKLNQLSLVNNVDEIKSKIEFYNDSIETLLSYLSQRSGFKIDELKQEFNIPMELEDIPGLKS